MSNVAPLFGKKNFVSKNQLEELEGLESQLVNLAAREIADVLLESETVDFADTQAIREFKAKKDSAGSTLTLMNRLGVYAAAKRGVLSREQWVAGNFPEKDVDRARNIVEMIRNGTYKK